MDWEVAIRYARLVQAAEDIAPDAVCGSSLTVPLRGTPVAYAVLANIFANDLATESNAARRELIVSIGFVAQDDAGNVVILIRGTHGIHEWLNDCRYCAVPCPFLPDAATPRMALPRSTCRFEWARSMVLPICEMRWQIWSFPGHSSR